MTYHRKNRSKQQPAHADDWLMTYADTITLLLCLFVAFLIVSTSKKEAQHQPPPVQVTVEAPRPATKLPDVFPDEQSFRKIQPEDLKPVEAPLVVAPEPVKVEAPLPPPPPEVKPPEKPQGDRITVLEMGSAAFFANGSATLSADGKVILQDVAMRLKGDEYRDYQITVEGHTDDSPVHTPVFPSNWELSTARASAVVHFFLDKGIAAQKLRAAGYADTFPKVPNRDGNGNAIPANQAQNRRVVIRLEKIEKSE